jgi:hypothetical protein
MTAHVCNVGEPSGRYVVQATWHGHAQLMQHYYYDWYCPRCQLGDYVRYASVVDANNAARAHDDLEHHP